VRASIAFPLAFAGCGIFPAWSGERRRKIAVIPKGNTHLFWRSVAAGVESRRAEENENLDVRFLGPTPEDSAEQQSNLVYTFAAQGVAAICLAPCDQRALVGAVKFAASRRIPVVIFDSAIDAVAGVDYVSEVSTANEKAGYLAGQELARRVGPHAKVVMLRYRTGSQSTEARERGILAALREGQCEILSDNQEAANEPKAKVLAMGELLREASGLVTPNESTTYGALLAVRELRLTSALTFVGFDSSPPLVQALRDREISALIVQDPKKMGAQALDLALKTLAGVRVPTKVDLPAVAIAHEDLERQAIRELLAVCEIESQLSIASRLV
jgi:ribose transport system substrate-binding protein